MSRTKKILFSGAALVLVGAVAAAVWWFRRTDVPTVAVETIRVRDLEAVVSASGKIQPKRLVNISADTSGRVVDLMVAEGDRVTQGQFLMQIDPRSLRTRVESGEAALRGAEAALDQARQSVMTAQAHLTLAEQTLERQRELWARQLTAREALDRVENEVRVAQSTLAERQKQVRTQELRLGQDRAALDSARYDLSKVRIESPIDGIVTRRNIQAGETAVVGTMNNAGTVLLTIADMSIIQAEIEVDETSVPTLSIEQPAVVTIDALPDRPLKGHVAEIGSSSIQTTGQQTGNTGGQQATNFKVVVVLDEPIPEARPGFTCTADITTATRERVPAVPIQAVAVRELIYDRMGRIVPQQPGPRTGRAAATGPIAPEPGPGETRKETEGVFVLRDGNIVDFVPVKIGIAGASYFEVLSGLEEGDRVITGPYSAVRQIVSGDKVKPEVSGVPTR